MIVKLLTEHPLEFPSLKGGCTGSCESTLVKIPHCCKSHVTRLICSYFSRLDVTTKRNHWQDLMNVSGVSWQDRIMLFSLNCRSES